MPDHTTNSVYTAFSFIGVILCCVPLYWHLEAWNVGTCFFMIWTAVMCLTQCVNSILWNSNFVNWSPVWCDITSHIMCAYNVAVPATTLCINRRLYHIAAPKTMQMNTKKEKRGKMIVDLLIAVGLPFLAMVMEYIVSGHRYNIYEDFGCYTAIYNTWLAYPLLFVWPLIISLVSSVYCILIIVAFIKRRRAFNELTAVNPNLTFSRYFRLIGLAAIDIICNVPVSIYALHFDLTFDGGPYPWISWSDTHFGFSRYYQIPRIIYSQSYSVVVQLELTRWTPVIAAILFFMFFGFAEEAKKNYRLAFSTISKAVGYGTISSAPSSSASSNFPGMRGITSSVGGVSVSLHANRFGEKGYSRHSMSSMSDKLSTSIYIDEADCRPADISIQEYSAIEITDTPVPLSSQEAPLRVPEAAHRKPSVPDAPKSVYPDSVLDV